ncbi:MAG: DNA-binding domain-containing protein [Candidatus Binatus sp.]
MTIQLKELQSLLYRLITAPSGAAEGLAAERKLGTGGLDAIVLGDERLSAEARVDIYANMYFYRILDALKADFPGTLAVLGDDNFHNLVTGYLLEYSPSEPSISYCGRHLADYLRDHPLRDGAPFVADLAKLERAVVEVFQGPDAAALEPDSLRAIAPEDWPAMKLAIHPSARILALDWRVSELLRAVEEQRPWKPAEQGAVKVLVWRRNARVLHRELERAEADALEAVSRGATFAEICDLVAADGDIQDPVAAINRMLARWLTDRLLTLSS